MLAPEFPDLRPGPRLLFLSLSLYLSLSLRNSSIMKIWESSGCRF